MVIMLLSKSYRKIEKHIKPCFLNKSVKYHIAVTDTLKETFTTYILSYLSTSLVLRHVLYVRQVTILLLATILNQWENFKKLVSMKTFSFQRNMTFLCSL